MLAWFLFMCLERPINWDAVRDGFCGLTKRVRRASAHYAEIRPTAQAKVLSTTADFPEVGLYSSYTLANGGALNEWAEVLAVGLAKPRPIEQWIVASLTEVVRTGRTIVLVEPSANNAPRLAHGRHVLVNGEVRRSGTGKELLANP